MLKFYSPLQRLCYQVSEIFSPYFKYCAEQTACQQYCKEQDRDNQVFKAYLAVSCDVLECLSISGWELISLLISVV